MDGLAYLYFRWGTKVVGAGKQEGGRGRERRRLSLNVAATANATTSPATTFLPSTPPLPSPLLPLLLLLSKGDLHLPSKCNKGRKKEGRSYKSLAFGSVAVTNGSASMR
jgi:hypothetical protein